MLSPSSLRRSGPFKSLLATALILAGSAFLPGPVLAHEFTSGPLTIVHPWSRVAPQGAKVVGGYLVIRNAGQADKLVAVSSELSDKVEIHEMAMKDNVMQMRMLDKGLEVPASGEVTLKPGSYHLMFMNPKRPLKEGELFKGTLTFEKAGNVPVEFKVEPMGATPAATDAHKGH